MNKLLCVLLCMVSAVFFYARFRAGHKGESGEGVTTMTLRTQAFHAAVNAYYLQHGHYPGFSGDEIFFALTNNIRNNIGILKESAVFDPWGNAFALSIIGTNLFVRSAGPDGVMSNRDDKTYEIPLSWRPHTSQ